MFAHWFEIENLSLDLTVLVAIKLGSCMTIEMNAVSWGPSSKDENCLTEMGPI